MDENRLGQNELDEKWVYHLSTRLQGTMIKLEGLVNSVIKGIYLKVPLKAPAYLRRMVVRGLRDPPLCRKVSAVLTKEVRCCDEGSSLL